MRNEDLIDSHLTHGDGDDGGEGDPDGPVCGGWSGLPELGESDWQRRFGGREWRHDGGGVYIKNADGEKGPLRTAGAPRTVTAICRDLGPTLIEASRTWQLPPEILAMVIATEAGMFREVGFTGPMTFRWEPHVKVRDVEVPFRGDYSFGPMQTLAGTARRIVRSRGLDYEPFETLPALRERPHLNPENLPGYDPDISIDVGAAFIDDARHRTGDNPILIAANYNAGGLYDASNPQSRYHNPWHLRTYGNHLDRAAEWFGDACVVIAELRTDRLHSD